MNPDNQTLMNEIEEKDQFDLEKYMQELKSEQQRTLKLFEQCSIEEMLDIRKSDFSSFVPFILNVSYNFIFFPTPEIFLKLRGLGFTSRETRWMIDIKIIEEEIKKIRNNKIFTLKTFLVQSIHAYLYQKMVAEIMNDANKIFGNQGFSLNSLFQNYYRRKSDRNRRNKKNSAKEKNDSPQKKHILFDALTDSQDKTINKLTGNKKSGDKTILNLLVGNCEKIFIPKILEWFVPLEITSNPQFAKAIAALLILITKDRNILKTEEQFIDSIGEYGNDYGRYLASRLNKMSNKH